MDFNELQNEAHMMALKKSFSPDALKREAWMHTPMTCMGVWFCSSIVRELFEKYYPQWKSVDDDLPPKYTDVLVRWGDWSYFVAYLNNTSWCHQQHPSITITHWMEIILFDNNLL